MIVYYNYIMNMCIISFTLLLSPNLRFVAELKPQGLAACPPHPFLEGWCCCCLSAKEEEREEPHFL